MSSLLWMCAIGQHIKYYFPIMEAKVLADVFLNGLVPLPLQSDTNRLK